MPELVEQMYCSQQIVIPPKFPYILKKYCKAAIKTQPYDLLRWSFEYFRALASNRKPPVKLRLEYPIFSTEGGLTRGCLKVLAHQLLGMKMVPLSTARQAWQGFCLDQMELKRIFCLCEVHMRQDAVPFLHLIAVAAGMLTKCLTHTMILLCETLTEMPEGASACISVHNFLAMYIFLARMDASKDVRYINGYREGTGPPPEVPKEEPEPVLSVTESDKTSRDEYWEEADDDMRFKSIQLTNDKIPVSGKLSHKVKLPLIGHIERSPSVERAARIERETYLMERTGKPVKSADVEKMLRKMSRQGFLSQTAVDAHAKEAEIKDVHEKFKETEEEYITIHVLDEEEKEIETVFGKFDDYDADEESLEVDEFTYTKDSSTVATDQDNPEGETGLTPAQLMSIHINKLYEARENRIEDLMQTFEEIETIVDKFMTANYDLGMVAGRQMSTTSGEFIVQHIEKEILEYVDDQIAILPDPLSKKRKARPEEVEMVRLMLEEFLEENLDAMRHEDEEVEEEEEIVPDVITVYAVPGIGPPVPDDIFKELVDYAMDVSKKQADLFMPRNIRHFLCPPLEKYEMQNYKMPEEEVPTGGILTD